MSEVAMALAQRKPSVPTSSVQLSRNAKGDVQFTVDVTLPDADEAADKAVAIFNDLSDLYPREPNGDTV
jgi:hypothetical protein